jgi:chromosome segregation ATPase
MESDFEKRMAALKADYERQLQELGQQKDQERESLRSDLQARIDELLR